MKRKYSKLVFVDGNTEELKQNMIYFNMFFQKTLLRALVVKDLLSYEQYQIATKKIEKDGAKTS